MISHQNADTIETMAALDRHELQEPKALAAQTVFAITSWGEGGRVQFMDNDGQWTPEIANAYVLPRAADFNWFASNHDKRSPSVIKIAIHQYFAALLELPGSNVTPFDMKAPVIAAWKDSVAIARPVNKEGQIVVQAEPFAVCSRPGASKEEPHVLTSNLWRAYVYDKAALSGEDFKKIDSCEGMARIPGWHGSPSSRLDLMCRVVSIMPA